MNDIRNTPDAWVARYVSAETSRCAQSRDAAIRGAHQPGAGEPAEKKRRTGQIDHMVDVEPVSWTLLLADSGYGSVEAVAEPVRREECDNAKNRPSR